MKKLVQLLKTLVMIFTLGLLIKMLFEKESETDLTEEKLQPQASTSEVSAKEPEYSESDLNARQEVIVALIKEKGQVDMGDLDDHIKSVSRRTIRRDLNELQDMGVIKKYGKTKSAYYKMA